LSRRTEKRFSIQVARIPPFSLALTKRWSFTAIRQTGFTFDYRWSLPEMLKLKDPLSGQMFSGDDLDFSGEVELSDATKHLLQVSYFKYCLMEGANQSLSIELSRKPDKREYVATAEQYSLVRKKCVLGPSRMLSGSMGFLMR